MDIQKERESFEDRFPIPAHWIDFDGLTCKYICKYNAIDDQALKYQARWEAWQAKAQAVPEQLDVNSILHDIDCYFDNGLSNTERTANNLLQSIYENLSGEVKAQEPAND